MDWKLFLYVFSAGVVLVFVQGISSWFDGYLTQAYMRSHGVTNGWSFMEHGGMWSDVFIISPVVAYIVSKYDVEYFSQWGLIILGVALVVSLAMGAMYQKNGITIPEAHTHDGTTTLAGWIHGLFAVAAIWTCALFYLNLVSPSVLKFDVLVISLLLTPFFFLGVVKFSDRWTFDTIAQWQVAFETAGLWAIASYRLWDS